MTLQPIRELYWATRYHAGMLASIYGEKLGLDWLTYNRVVMERFAMTARGGSEALAAAVKMVWPDLQSMVDYGCGTGHYVAAFSALGVAGIGFERSRHVRRYARELGVEIRPFNLISTTAQSADLAMSLEVIEHLPPELGERLLDLMAQSSPRVVFSGAHPGQGGNGHINEQPAEHWQARWAARGFAFLPDETGAVRKHLRAHETVPWWISHNVMLFRNRHQAISGNTDTR